jgi:hypothetical protein
MEKTKTKPELVSVFVFISHSYHIKETNNGWSFSELHEGMLIFEY